MLFYDCNIWNVTIVRALEIDMKKKEKKYTNFCVFAYENCNEKIVVGKANYDYLIPLFRMRISWYNNYDNDNCYDNNNRNDNYENNSNNDDIIIIIIIIEIMMMMTMIIVRRW